ncbi:MAG: hypothetical protein Kow00121_00820 [Elainellaceae cyanobacterium]
MAEERVQQSEVKVPPRVFISYSWDSDKHKNRVLQLANALRQYWGVETDIDQYVKAKAPFTPPQGWDLWMEKRIEWAEFVLIVCTETYMRRFRGDEEPGIGRGVTWEGTIIRQHLYNNRLTDTKFIPVVFSSQDLAHVPLILNAHDKYILNNKESFGNLVYRLRKQPIIAMPEVAAVKLPPPPDPVFFAPQEISIKPSVSLNIAQSEASSSTGKTEEGKVGSERVQLQEQSQIIENTIVNKTQELATPRKNRPRDVSSNKVRLKGSEELEEVIKNVDKLYARRTRSHLNDIQKAIIQGTWHKWTYEEIANNNRANLSVIRSSGERLWEIISKSLGEKVGKSNFQKVMRRYLLKNKISIVTNDKKVTGRETSVQICEYISTLSGHTGWINSVIVSSNRQIISGSQDGAIKFWNLDTGKYLRDLGKRDFLNSLLSKKHSDRVYAVAISLDSKVLASASEDRTVIVWDLTTYGNLYPPLRHLGAVYCVAISPDNQFIASGCSDHTINIWDLKTGKQIKRFIERDAIKALTFSPDGQMLISASEDKIIKTWTVQSWASQNLPFDYESSPDSLALSENREILAISYKNRKIKVIDFHTREQLYSLSGQVVALSPDDEILATAFDKEISLWKQKTGELICPPVRAGNLVRSLVFSNDGLTLVSGQGEEIKTWRIRKDKLLP